MFAINLKYNFEDRVELVSKVLHIILTLSNRKITKHENKILAYAAVAGNISTIKTRKGCMEYMGGISEYSLNNASSILQRKGLLQKKDGKISIVDGLKFDFTKDLLLNISLNGPQDNSK